VYNLLVEGVLCEIVTCVVFNICAQCKARIMGTNASQAVWMSMFDGDLHLGNSHCLWRIHKPIFWYERECAKTPVAGGRIMWLMPKIVSVGGFTESGLW
jgi:hypothetical protein